MLPQCIHIWSIKSLANKKNNWKLVVKYEILCKIISFHGASKVRMKRFWDVFPSWHSAIFAGSYWALVLCQISRKLLELCQWLEGQDAVQGVLEVWWQIKTWDSRRDKRDGVRWYFVKKQTAAEVSICVGGHVCSCLSCVLGGGSPRRGHPNRDVHRWKKTTEWVPCHINSIKVGCTCVFPRSWRPETIVKNTWQIYL